MALVKAQNLLFCAKNLSDPADHDVAVALLARLPPRPVGPSARRETTLGDVTRFG
jgi:hypothetical protein